MVGKRLSNVAGNRLPKKGFTFKTKWSSSLSLRVLSCCIRVNRRADRISQLSDDIILHILSFLEFKEAAATSVLSSRWLDLWKYIPTSLHFDLSFKDKVYPSEELMSKYTNWVNSVLKSHKCIMSLKEFTFSFVVDKSAQHQVTEWLEFAFLRGVERLELNWDSIKRKDPAVLGEILRNMRIPSSDFKSLKVLCVRLYKMSSDGIEFFMRNCPLLERLVIEGAVLTSDLKVGGSLKHLDIRSRSSENSIRVIAPNLYWFTIDHGSKRVVLEKVPKLVNMNFFCRSGDTMHDFANVASQLEILIITLYHPKASFSVPKMPKLKKLVVYYRYAMQGVLLPITCFIEACPRLEEFILEIGELPIGMALFEVPKVCPTFRQHYLKRFALSGFWGGGSSDRLELVRYIVRTCVALEEIVIGEECDRLELVRYIVDSCVPLDKIILQSPPKMYAGTVEQRQAFEKTVQLQQFPSNIRVRIV